MALAIYFPGTSFTKDQYDAGLRRLEDAGEGSPPGRSYHCAFVGPGGGVQVFDVWDSQESFDRFGESLIPILQEVGADPGEPQIAEVHNIVVG